MKHWLAYHNIITTIHQDSCLEVTNILAISFLTRSQQETLTLHYNIWKI